MNLPEGTHYGLIAQEVEQVLPGLVKDATLHMPPDQNPTSQGMGGAPVAQRTEALAFKAVNYTELIPILIKGIQELKKENEELKVKAAETDAMKTEVAELRQIVLELKNTNTYTVTATKASLEQNSPNPVSGTTTIYYRVPESSTSARITLTNAKGQVMRTITLNNRGIGQVTLNTHGLASGAYHYTLYVDGKVADTKRLVIAR